MVQALNDTAREINNALWQRRRRGPSLATISSWHDEFITKGIDHTQSFASYRKGRMKQWYQQRRKRNRNDQ